MSEIPHRYRDTIYNYTSYDKNKIPFNGERRYFNTILTGITHPCSVFGNGLLKISELPFLEIINIETAVNINLEVLRINGNRICLKNTAAVSITVNLGTAAIPDNETMEADEIWEMYFNGSNWIEISKNYSLIIEIGKVPIGSIIAWHKDLTGCPSLPSEFAECNGQIISDSNSPFNGQTLPDLNGDARFLRGGATSGTEQDDAMQRITGTFTTRRGDTAVLITSADGVFSRTLGSSDNAYDVTGSNNVQIITFDNANSISPNAAKTDDEETRPINMSVVWIMRIK